MIPAVLRVEANEVRIELFLGNSIEQEELWRIRIDATLAEAECSQMIPPATLVWSAVDIDVPSGLLGAP